jgi:hypothetical protein
MAFVADGEAMSALMVAGHMETSTVVVDGTKIGDVGASRKRRIWIE